MFDKTDAIMYLLSQIYNYANKIIYGDDEVNYINSLAENNKNLKLDVQRVL